MEVVDDLSRIKKGLGGVGRDYQSSALGEAELT